MDKWVLGLILFGLIGCAELRVKRYQGILDPMVGVANKQKVSQTLGQPVKCERVVDAEKCEYRTIAGRNDHTPSVHRPAPGFGPDLSPYEHFDVINVYFGEMGVMKDWEPVVTTQ